MNTLRFATIAATLIQLVVTVTSLFPLTAFPAAAGEALTPADDSAILRGDLAAACDAHVSALVPFGYAGSIGVMVDGEIVLAKGYGLADRESGRPMRADTVATTGSITKQFTGACILKLQDEGALSVDDLITKYFDDVPLDKRTITIHHLLTHSAGFPGAIGDDFASPTREQFLREALATELLFEPGSRYEYSNVGFSLAAIIVELVAGREYETFLREELLLPAGLEHTGYNAPGYSADELAVGYREGERWGTFLERPSYTEGPSWHLIGNGGMHSTVLDMLGWHRATATLLSDEARAAWKARHVDEGFGDSWYGYGWSTFPSPRGGDLVTHNGGNGTFSADFRHYVDDDVVVFGTSNSSAFVADHVTEVLGRLALDLPVEAPPATVDLDDATLGQLLGVYRLGDDTVTVTRSGGGLLLTASGSRTENLLAGGDGRATKDDSDALAQRTADAVNAWIDGDARPLHAALGGGMPLADLERDLGEFRAMRENAYGPLDSASIATVRREGPEVRIVLTMHHEHGPAFLECGWEGDRLVMLAPIRALPDNRVGVQPVSPTEFLSYRPGPHPRIRVTFDPAEGTLVFATYSGEVRLTR